MEIKKNASVSTGDFWYDLTKGGYIKPKQLLVKAADVEKVEEAIKTIRDFEKSCEQQIEGFIQ